MIRKLQKRFVRIAVLVLTAAMVVVVGIVNTANLLTVRGELAGTVKELADIIVPSRGFQNQGMHDSPEGPGLPEAPGPDRAVISGILSVNPACLPCITTRTEIPGCGT